MVSLDTHIGWLKRSWICMSLLQREVTTEKERQFKKKKKNTSTETSIKIDKHTGALVSVHVPQLLSLCSWAQEPQLLGPHVTTEAEAP